MLCKLQKWNTCWHTLNTSYTKHCFGKYATNFTLLQFKCMLYQLEQANTKKKPMQQFLTKKELCCLVKPLALSWLDPTQQQKIRVRLIPFYFPWISIFFGCAISLQPLVLFKATPSYMPQINCITSATPWFACRSSVKATEVLQAEQHSHKWFLCHF